MGRVVLGDTELFRKLQKLEYSVAQEVALEAMLAAAQPIAEEARKLAPKRTGRLSQGIKVRKSRGKKKVSARVSLSKGFFKGDDFYGGFIEFGYLHGSRRLGNKRKHIPARPFMRPAFYNNKDLALQITQSTLRAGIERIAGS